jgi:predicted CxxxxCH...CXXCH cytochrome family protein
MNRSFIVAVLTVTMIVMMSTASYAIIAPHSFYCDNCHGKHLGTTALPINNGCVTCHNSYGEAPRMPFDADAMSNSFGTSPDQPVKGSKSTHNWLSNVPIGQPWPEKFMVTEPTNTALNTGNNGVSLINTVACLRCHNSKSNANSTLEVNKPFLRISNAGDALCFECHKPRRVTNHTAGSHPVDYRSYSAAYKSNTTAYRKVPINANPYNRTSDLGKYLKNGKVVCMTCHAPHYADSSSATLDNRSTASGFGVDDPVKGLKAKFQNSNGELLRTDRYGATAESINICSSCHKESKNINHNGKGQNIQCDHCHAAHVDYTGDGSAVNLYLVRRDFSGMSTSNGKIPAGKKAVYNSATSLRFMRADGKGICQVCHTPTPGVAIHDLTDTRKEDCLACHTHANGFSAADCNSCHGQPPVTSYVGGPNGKASQNYAVDESFTPHATHADAAYYKYACKNCHYDGTPQGSHNTLSKTGTATFQSVFVETAGSVGANLGFKNVPTDYNTTTKTCSNVYCHSNGNPRGGSIAWKSPVTPGWEFGKNKIVGQASECTSCHEYGATLITNAHAAHVTSVGLKCYVCHNATMNMNGGITDRTKHANGAKDISFVVRPSNFIGVFNATFDGTDASCTNSCHGSATPLWTNASTGACGTCHAVPATTGSHNLHMLGTTGPKLGTTETACSNCHTFASGNGKHANGQIDVTGCTPCHPGSKPIWTSTGLVTCESCHTGTASVVGSATAPLKVLGAGHSQYSSAVLNKVRCTSCHNSAANHIGAGPTEKRLLVAGNDLCNSCHTTAAGKGLPEARLDLFVHGGTVNPLPHYNTSADLATIAAVRADSCAGCHDTHGTTNKHNIRTTINGQTVVYKNISGLMVTTKNANNIYNGLCQVCHTKTKYYRNYTSPATHYTGDCLSCHVHKPDQSPLFAFKPGGTCDTCHGYPPAGVEVTRLAGGIGTQSNYSGAKFRDYTAGGGAHTVAGHLSKLIKPIEGSVNCTNCHFTFNSDHNNGSVPVKRSFVNVVVDPKFKFNNATSIVYDFNANTCSNVSCHFKPSPNWVTGN